MRGAAERLLFLGLALVLSSCHGAEPPLIIHKGLPSKLGPFGPELPVQDCEDVDVVRRSGTTVRMRVQNWATEDHSQVCETGIGIERPDDEDEFLEKLLRRTGLCPDCRVVDNWRLNLRLREAILYIRGFISYSFPGIEHSCNRDHGYPLARYAQMQVLEANFIVRTQGLWRSAVLTYECPTNDPDHYDIACLRFITRPTIEHGTRWY